MSFILNEGCDLGMILHSFKNKKVPIFILQDTYSTISTAVLSEVLDTLCLVEAREKWYQITVIYVGRKKFIPSYKHHGFQGHSRFCLRITWRSEHKWTARTLFPSLPLGLDASYLKPEYQVPYWGAGGPPRSPGKALNYYFFLPVECTKILPLT